MKEKGISYYFNEYKRIFQVGPCGINDKDRAIKVAVLSSFTVLGIKETLAVRCHESNIYTQQYIADYNQYAQEILNPESGMYKFSPDLVILFIDIKAMMGDLYLMPYSISDVERREWLKSKLYEIYMFIEKLKQGCHAKILLHNMEVPSHSPLGILENKREFGFIESVETINISLRENYKNDTQVHIFDYNAFCSKIGKQDIFDYKMYYLGDIKLDLQNIPSLCDEYLGYIKPLASKTRKCLVLDLDNTLWGGIVGEEGISGIKLGPIQEGRPFLEFQKYILSLFDRGILLAINSKNNFNDAIEVINKHPYMVLKEEHFASIKINWDDKIANMKAIAEDINIGLDSLVFIDDDKMNRDMIKQALPEVLVIDLPEDASLYLNTIMRINDFNSLQITQEDMDRGKVYVQQKQREKLENSFNDVSEYLKGLEMTATIELANTLNIPRISQLTLKTNQFNMTTRRYQEEEIKKFANHSEFILMSLKLEDKFGDNGIVGVALVEKGITRWRIDTFLLSCRVIGRKVEEVMLAYILQEARNSGIEFLVGEYIQTEKNSPAKDFYKSNGFKFIKKDDLKEIWEYEVSKEFTCTELIKVVRRTE